MVEYSFDRDDYIRDFRIDESREQARLDEMRRQSFEDEFRRDAERNREQEAIREVINNDNIIIDNDLQKIVNDASMVMDERGRIRKLDSASVRMKSSPPRFTRPGIQFPPIGQKRTRKKTKMDRTMSKCLKMANKRMRKKNGQLRKGKTMRDVMRLAHRLCKKE